MRMERLAVMMPHSTVKAFRRYSQIHDIDLCVTAKIAVTKYCHIRPSEDELNDKSTGQERIFISMPDTAMRLLELWSENTGITKPKLMEWALRRLAQDQNKEEESET